MHLISDNYTRAGSRKKRFSAVFFFCVEILSAKPRLVTHGLKYGCGVSKINVHLSDFD